MLRLSREGEGATQLDGPKVMMHAWQNTFDRQMGGLTALNCQPRATFAALHSSPAHFTSHPSLGITSLQLLKHISSSSSAMSEQDQAAPHAGLPDSRLQDRSCSFDFPQDA